MSSKSEDDYWFASETKAFDFEDELNSDAFSTFKSTEDQRPKTNLENTFTGEFQRSYVPIKLILSQDCLNKLLDNSLKENTSKNKLTIKPAETIKRILLGQAYSLDIYRSLESKTELLDAAINIADGNAILTVILFLARTLQKSLVYKILSSRPVAIQHYASYLMLRLNTNELTDLLIMTGQSSVVGIKLFKLIVQNNSCKESVDTLLKKLENLFNNHYKTSVVEERDSEIVKNFIALLGWQKSVQRYPNMKDVFGQSVNKSLAICCQNYWGVAETNLCSPQLLTKMQGVSERQLHWLYLDVKSVEKSWDEILKMFIKNNWFGNKKVMNTSLNVEIIVLLLSDRQAPVSVLEAFLSLMEDSEKALSLAIKSKCHQFVINYYVAQRDKISLINYKTKINRQSEEYFYIENLLSSTNTKWKN